MGRRRRNPPPAEFDDESRLVSSSSDRRSSSVANTASTTRATSACAFDLRHSLRSESKYTWMDKYGWTQPQVNVDPLLDLDLDILVP